MAKGWQFLSEEPVHETNEEEEEPIPQESKHTTNSQGAQEQEMQGPFDITTMA